MLAVTTSAAAAAPADETAAACRRDIIDEVTSAGQGTEMTVAVRLGGRLGAGRRSVRVAAGATVEVLLAALAAEVGLTARDLVAAAIAVDGEVVGREHVLRDGDTLALILPVASG